MTNHRTKLPERKATQDAIKRRAKQVRVQWNLSAADARRAAMCEVAMQHLLIFCDVAPEIIARVQLVKIGDDICVDEHALNDIDPVEFMAIRARMGNALGMMPR